MELVFFLYTKVHLAVAPGLLALVLTLQHAKIVPTFKLLPRCLLSLAYCPACVWQLLEVRCVP